MKLGQYQHYKGKMYEVFGVAKHSETLEDMVIYQALYDSPEFGDQALWVRPLHEFIEKVRSGNKQVPRFKFIK